MTGAGDSEALREASSYADFPEYDRGLPYRVTGRVSTAGVDPFRTLVTGVLQRLEFHVVQNRPAKEVSSRFYRGPSGPQGLVIGERGLKFDEARRKQGNLVFAVLVPLGILLIAAAVALVNFSDQRFLFLTVGGGFSILGAIFLGQRRWSFSSEMLYVYYSVSSSQSPARAGGDLLRLNLTITAGQVITQNVSSKISNSRQFVATIDGDADLKALPARVLRLLEGSPAA